MRPRRVSDEEFLEAARTCLLEHGAAVSLDAIARCVGVSGPAVLKRFGTKEQLVTRALLSDAPPDLSGGPEPGPLRPQLVAILVRTAKLVANAAPRLATLRAGGVTGAQIAENPHPRAARQNLLKWLTKAEKSHGLVHPDLEIAVDLLVALVEARAFMAWVEPKWSRPLRGWAWRAVDTIFDLDAPAGRARRRKPVPKRSRHDQRSRLSTQPVSRIGPLSLGPI